MSETPQDPGGEAQEGGYGYPTLEQEVTPEVLEAGSDEPDGSSGAGSDAGNDDTADEDGDDGGDDGGSTPGELEEDPEAVEPTD